MDKVTSSFVQVWHTSSTHIADENNGVMEGIVRASGDLKITVDFPVVRETQVVTLGLPPNDQQAKLTDSQSVTKHGKNTLTDQPKTEKTDHNYDSTVDKILLACDHFSELTTFHGMRLVCSRGPNHIRRLIWTVMIMACMVALALQVRQQVLYFLSNPKSINVEKKFVDSLEFPTVTICNENLFRISAAYEHGLYEVINELFNGSINENVVNRTGVADLRLDELNYKAGNKIENMILKCKWNTLENCNHFNFTRIITDHGLCYSFNGPDSSRELSVQTPGATKNLQLTLNIEEYERMSGSQVASGIHILVHNRREYPLVKQLGQAVAAGSHTYIALTLKKESRLGYPYDSCQEGILIHVPNQTYSYSLPACQTECYVTFVLSRCGCRDFFMPGNSPVCTFKQYVKCLKYAQKEYDAAKVCDCSAPCDLDFVESSYSYGSLSKLAKSKVRSADLENIKIRLQRALDINDYINSDVAFKKEYYYNFTLVLNQVKKFYISQMVTLHSQFKQKLMELNKKTNQMYTIRQDLLWSQIYVIKKYFIEPKRTLDRVTIGQVVNNVYLFSQQVLNYVRLLDMSTDNTTRSFLFNLLTNELKVRVQLTNMSLSSLEDLQTAYSSGLPLYNDSLVVSQEQTQYDVFMSWRIVPKKLLQIALNRSTDVTLKEMMVTSDMNDIMDTLIELIDILTLKYQTGQPALDSVKEILQKFKTVCESYFLSNQILYDETIEWPLAELITQRVDLQSSKHICDKYFKATDDTANNVIDVCFETKMTSLGFYSNFSDLVQKYLVSFNSSKFDLADLLLGRDSEMAKYRLRATSHLLVSYFSDLNSGLNRISSCLKENVKEILEDDDSLKAAYDQRGQKVGVSLSNISQLATVDIVQLENILVDMKKIVKENEQLLKAIDYLNEDLKEFKNQANIDLAFYSKNFIFLDIFFPDISYIVTEQQVAYDAVKLLSDVGGSMGLLVGASAISLFEFVDFFCLLAFALCWKRKPTETGGKVYETKENID